MSLPTRHSQKKRLSKMILLLIFNLFSEQSEGIEFPKQDHEIDEYVEGSSKPINFSALRDQHIEFTKNFFIKLKEDLDRRNSCLLYTSPSPRDRQKSRMPSSA